MTANRMKYKRINDEVLYTVLPLVRVAADFIADLKAEADGNARGRIRLCAHRDTKADVHEMLIVLKSGAYIRPHKHSVKSESFHVVEGDADVVIFDEQGGILEVISMGEYASGRDFYYRLDDTLYHTLLVRSEYFVFHETTGGPFEPEDTIYPSWAPDEGAPERALVFMNQLAERTSKHIGKKR